MAKTRTRQAGTFRVRTRAGDVVDVHVWVQEVDASTLADTSDRWLETSRAYRLGNGTPVNADAAGELTNAQTGEVLRRV